MSFLTPIWLFAATAILIPVVIHLWNIKEGKTLKVGSIALIEASSRKPSRSLKLIDLLLLLLRCLLLILLALVLAMPFVQKKPKTTKIKGWLLIPKEDLKEAYQKLKPKADSLLKAGYEFHYFNSGFAKADINQALTDTGKTLPGKPTSYWNLITQLDQKIPGLPAFVITPNGLSHFTSTKPKVALKLQWLTYPSADSTATWISGAWFTGNKDIRVVQATSKPSGTSYIAQTISSGQQKESAFNITAENGQPVISLKNSSQPPVAIDTADLKILINADKNQLDAGYLKAALETVGQFTQHKISVSNYTAKISKSDWLFWLSDKPVPKNVSGKFKNVFSYENGKVTQLNSWISNDDVFSVSGTQQTVPLYKEVANKNTYAEIVWHDGFSSPVLSKVQQGPTAFYHFASRFNPSWSDLVWSPAFPKMMLQLVIPGETMANNSVYDKRVITPQQISPEVMTEKYSKPIMGKDLIPLTNYFWLALALLFFAERLLASRNPVIVKKETLQNG